MTTGPIAVLVPDEVGERALADIDGLHVVRYQDKVELVTLGTNAEVLIPGFRPSDDTTELLERLPRLRLVQLLSAGAERWVHHVPAGVDLSDCRGAHGGLTAEWVVAAILSMLREFPAFLRDQDRELWQRRPTDTLIGKQILLIGAGNVADQVVQRLGGFGVAGITRVGRTPRADVHGPDELPVLLPDQDVVVLVVPLTRQTDRMVDSAFLAAMPNDAILVNASRGPVVDTDALVAELRANRLRAVLDVVEPVPLPKGHPLWTMPGVLITPHVAGIGTRPSWRERAYAVVRQQLAAVARGERPSNLVVNGY